MKQELLYTVKKWMAKRHSLVSGLAGSAGWYNSFLQDARGGRILVYHGVCEKDPHRFNTLFITAAQFEQQLKLFRKYCHVISLDDFFHRRFHPDKFNVSLSFDDGFANNHQYVWPLLEKYRLPATLFVTAVGEAGYNYLWNDFLTIHSRYGPAQLTIQGDRFRKKWGRAYVSENSGRLLSDLLRDTDFDTKEQMMEQWPGKRHLDSVHADYWMQLSATQLKELSASPYITIGSHGYYHNDLGRITKESVREELMASKRFLESIIHKPVTQLAFPYGSYRGETITEALACGYEQLYATGFLSPSDAACNCMRERMGINPFVSSYRQLLAAIRGNYD